MSGRPSIRQSFLNALRTVVRSFSLLESKVDDLQPLPFSVVHRIGCPAVLFGKIADTHAAIVHQMAVPLVHTAFGLFLTQEAFADKIGKFWSFVAKIESPTRVFGVSMETLFKIAEALEVPISKLFEE